jgi:hypothetical protein
MPRTFSDAVEAGGTIAGELTQRNTTPSSFKRKWSDHRGPDEKSRFQDRIRKALRVAWL